MILNTLIAGDGPPVVLLHGLFGAAKNLGAIARALSTQARVLSMDLRNHGDSPHAAGMNYADMAADVAATMAAQSIGKARVIGHSMGGKAAMALALSRPELVERLAVLDIAPMAYDHDYSDYVTAMRAIPLDAGLTRHAAEAALAGAVPDAPMRAFLLNNLILGEAPRWRVALEEISTAMPDLFAWGEQPGWQPYPGPTLFLRGGASHYVPEDAAPAIMRLFPGATIQTISGAGHWLHAEQPAAVNAALSEFLFP
jgi:pimeloyl-ACP methyl ester carboxylesterase